MPSRSEPAPALVPFAAELTTLLSTRHKPPPPQAPKAYGSMGTGRKCKYLRPVPVYTPG